MLGHSSTWKSVGRVLAPPRGSPWQGRNGGEGGNYINRHRHRQRVDNFRWPLPGASGTPKICCVGPADGMLLLLVSGSALIQGAHMLWGGAAFGQVGDVTLQPPMMIKQPSLCGFKQIGPFG